MHEHRTDRSLIGLLSQEALPSLLTEHPSLRVVWQCGSAYYDALAARVTPEAHPRVLLAPFLHDMQAAYSAASVVVARAGAITCSELAATGSAAILVPSPNVAEDHQTANARALSDEGAAVLLPEAELAAVSTGAGTGAGQGGGGGRLACEVGRLLSDSTSRRALATTAASRGQREGGAAERVAGVVEELMAGKQP